MPFPSDAKALWSIPKWKLFLGPRHAYTKYKPPHCSNPRTITELHALFTEAQLSAIHTDVLPQPNFKNFKNFQQSFRYVLYVLATLCAKTLRSSCQKSRPHTLWVPPPVKRKGTKSESFSESHNKQSVMKSSLWPRSCSHMVERCLRAKAETDTWNQLETNKTCKSEAWNIKTSWNENSNSFHRGKLSGWTEAQENLQNVASKGPTFGQLCSVLRYFDPKTLQASHHRTHHINIWGCGKNFKRDVTKSIPDMAQGYVLKHVSSLSTKECLSNASFETHPLHHVTSRFNVKRGTWSWIWSIK